MKVMMLYSEKLLVTGMGDEVLRSHDTQTLDDTRDQCLLYIVDSLEQQQLKTISPAPLELNSGGVFV